MLNGWHTLCQRSQPRRIATKRSGRSLGQGTIAVGITCRLWSRKEIDGNPHREWDPNPCPTTMVSALRRMASSSSSRTGSPSPNDEFPRPAERGHQRFELRLDHTDRFRETRPNPRNCLGHCKDKRIYVTGRVDVANDQLRTPALVPIVKRSNQRTTTTRGPVKAHNKGSRRHHLGGQTARRVKGFVVAQLGTCDRRPFGTNAFCLDPPTIAPPVKSDRHPQPPLVRLGLPQAPPRTCNPHRQPAMHNL